MPCLEQKTSLRGAERVLPPRQRQGGKIYVFLFGLRFPGLFFRLFFLLKDVNGAVVVQVAQQAQADGEAEEAHNAQ